MLWMTIAVITTIWLCFHSSDLVQAILNGKISLQLFSPEPMQAQISILAKRLNETLLDFQRFFDQSTNHYADHTLTQDDIYRLQTQIHNLRLLQRLLANEIPQMFANSDVWQRIDFARQILFGSNANFDAGGPPFSWIITAGQARLNEWDHFSPPQSYKNIISFACRVPLTETAILDPMKQSLINLRFYLRSLPWAALIAQQYTIHRLDQYRETLAGNTGKTFSKNREKIALKYFATMQREFEIQLQKIAFELMRMIAYESKDSLLLLSKSRHHFFELVQSAAIRRLDKQIDKFFLDTRHRFDRFDRLFGFSINSDDKFAQSAKTMIEHDDFGDSKPPQSKQSKKQRRRRRKQRQASASNRPVSDWRKLNPSIMLTLVIIFVALLPLPKIDQESGARKLSENGELNRNNAKRLSQLERKNNNNNTIDDDDYDYCYYDDYYSGHGMSMWYRISCIIVIVLLAIVLIAIWALVFRNDQSSEKRSNSKNGKKDPKK